MWYIIRPLAMSLIPVPKRNPSRAPTADLVDCQPSLRDTRNSARKAPARVPRIIPTGGTSIPTINPIMAPLPAALLPPVTLVKYAGTT